MKVLKLSAQGLPQSWISLEQAVIHYAAKEVRWESGGEVAVFHGGHNAITGQQLTEAHGWLMMAVLKMVRDNQRSEAHQDSCEDLVAYASLYGEARLK